LRPFIKVQAESSSAFPPHFGVCAKNMVKHKKTKN